MNKYVLIIVSVLLGCGSSGGGSSSSLAGASLASIRNSNKTLTFQVLPIGRNQVLPFNNILRCIVKNEGTQKYTFNGFNVSFTSSNPLFNKINIEFIIEGKKVSEVYPAIGNIKTHLKCDVSLDPGESVMAYVLVNPHSLLQKDSLTIIVHNFFIDSKEEVAIIPSQKITVNTGGIFRARVDEIPLFIPYQVGTNEITVWQERLEDLSGLEQELYDYEFRFRAGNRNAYTNIAMRGIIRMDVKKVGASTWEKIDEIPIAGHHTSQHYKLFFFGEAIPKNTLVRLVINLTKFKSGDVFLVDRTTLGSDTGFINYPTRHGPVFRCN